MAVWRYGGVCGKRSAHLVVGDVLMAVGLVCEWHSLSVDITEGMGHRCNVVLVGHGPCLTRVNEGGGGERAKYVLSLFGVSWRIKFDPAELRARVA